MHANQRGDLSLLACVDVVELHRLLQSSLGKLVISGAFGSKTVCFWSQDWVEVGWPNICRGEGLVSRWEAARKCRSIIENKHTHVSFMLLYAPLCSLLCAWACRWLSAAIAWINKNTSTKLNKNINTCPQLPLLHNGGRHYLVHFL